METDDNKEIIEDTIPVQFMENVVVEEQFSNTNGDVSPISKSIKSPNFATDSKGWLLKSNGEVEMNGNRVVSTNFTPVFSAKGITFYISDGTTPNGNLSGNAGDVCFGADAGKAYKCTSTTTWVSFT